MGGGSGGGSFSSSDMSRLEQAAEGRLREALGETVRILFACETEDRSSLDQKVGSTNFAGKQVSVIDPSGSPDIDGEVRSSGIVVVYTDKADKTGFLHKVVEAATDAKKYGVHVKATSHAKVPAGVSSSRWRTLSWEKLIELL